MECNFKNSVIDHLPIAFEMVFTSLEDEEITYKILRTASQNFTARQALNLRHIQDQESSRSHGKNVKNRDSRRRPRKQAARRSYTPTDADLFQYLVKESLEAEERRQEAAGRIPGARARFFRYLHELFRNANTVRGAFLPTAAVFGILCNTPPRKLTKISAHLHGIFEDEDANHRDYRDHEFFGKELAALLERASERFGPHGFFKMVSASDLSMHDDSKLYLDDLGVPFIALEPAGRKDAQTLRDFLRFLGPWGQTPVCGEEVPTFDLTYTLIDKLQPRSEMDDRTLEMIRFASVMNPEFVDAILTL